MANTAQIGTVEVLRSRTYAIDGDSPDPRLHAMVSPGIFPLYLRGTAIFWVMEGEILMSNRRVGDGLFVMSDVDTPSGIKITFPSKTFGAREFEELAEHAVAQPGPEQRLIIKRES
jgi:hypothetical protein